MIGQLRQVRSSRRIGLMTWEMNGTNCVWTREGKLIIVLERFNMGPKEGFRVLESQGFRWVETSDLIRDSVEAFP